MESMIATGQEGVSTSDFANGLSDALQSASKSLTNSAAKSTPFKLVACRNPIGRPKGTKKQTAVSYQPPKPTKRPANPVRNLRLRRAIITTTTTTSTTTTTYSTTVELEMDNTLEGIEEISEHN